MVLYQDRYASPYPAAFKEQRLVNLADSHMIVIGFE